MTLPCSLPRAAGLQWIFLESERTFQRVESQSLRNDFVDITEFFECFVDICDSREVRCQANQNCKVNSLLKKESNFPQEVFRVRVCNNTAYCRLSQ